MSKIYGGRTDAQLLIESADHPDLFALIYERHVDAVLAYFFRRTGCAQTAADLTAETFAQAFTSRGRFTDTGAPARAVRMRVGLDMAYSDVAGRLGCSEGAARVRVSRGLTTLAMLLEGP